MRTHQSFRYIHDLICNHLKLTVDLKQPKKKTKSSVWAILRPYSISLYTLLHDDVVCVLLFSFAFAVV